MTACAVRIILYSTLYCFGGSTHTRCFLFVLFLESHFKAHKQVKHPLPPKPDGPPPEPRGESVYETILPASIRWKASDNADDTNNKMPLIDHLATHFDRGTCWHRNDERRARGLHPVHSSSLQLEGWERELVWMEILLLAGSPHASFRHLARGWGRDKGFQTVLTNFICQRFGNVHRKARSKTNFANDNNKNDPVVVHDNMAANVWDDANYGNSRQTNEALAANLFGSLFDSTTADPTVATTEHNNNNNHHSESKSTDRMNQNSSVHNHHHPTTTTAAATMQGGNAPPQQEPNMALLPEPTIICCPPAHHTTTAPPLLVETTTTTVPIPQSNHDETILDVQQPQFETAASIQPSDEIVLPITTQTLVLPHTMETTTVVDPTLTQPSHTLPPNYSMELFQQQQQQDPSNHHLLDREVGDDDPLENGVPMAML